MARLIRTEKEVEGRYTEQWVVVEGDDVLDQWPAGPGDVVGRPAPRQDGHQRARGQAIYTADLALPGMLHAAVLRSPYARARVKNLDLSGALELPGVLGAIGPVDCHVLQEEAELPRRAGRGSRGGEPRQGARGAGADRDRVGRARAAPRPRGGRAPEVVRRRRAAPLRARGRRRSLRGRRRRGRGRVPHADRPAQLDGDPPVGLPLGGRHARGLHLDAVHLGRPRLDCRTARAAARPRARRLQLHGRRLRLEEQPRRLHVRRDRPRRQDRAAGALRADAARGEPGQRQPQRDDSAPARGRPLRRHAGRARGGVRERDRLVGLLRARPTGRWRCSTPARTCGR